MDNQTQNDIPEYVKSLPQAVQDLVFEGVWEDRTIEIGKKYSLNDNQIDTLANTVVLVLIGLEKPETFLETIITDLGISRLLAEQIMSDLDDRVFDYALKKTENPGLKAKMVAMNTQVKKPENIPTNTSPATVSKGTFDTRVPEVLPSNPPQVTTQAGRAGLPMVEKGEVAHNNPIPSRPATAPVPRYIPTSQYKPTPIAEINPVQKPESVQQPVPVPRFVATPINIDEKGNETSKLNALNTSIREESPRVAPVSSIVKPVESVTSLKVSTPQNMMDNKLKNVTIGIKEEVKIEKPPEKYTADPYREPLN